MTVVVEKSSQGNKAVFKSLFSSAYRNALLMTLFVACGNIGYYFLRVHFDLGAHAMEEENIMTFRDYGRIKALAFGVNVFGKLFGGFLNDLINRPKLIFACSLLMCALCTVLMTWFATVDAFYILWSGIRWFTSSGRMGVIKIVSVWWPKELMGTILGFMNVSTCLAEAIARTVLGLSLKVLSWREMFLLASAVGAATMIPVILFVKDNSRISPANHEHEQAMTKQKKQFQASQQSAKNASSIDSSSLTESHRLSGVPELMTRRERFSHFMVHVVLPPFKIFRFYLLLLISITTQVMRDVNSAWATQFIAQVTGQRESVWMTMIFSVCGAFSSIVGGWLVDRVPRYRRAFVPILAMLFSVGSQIALYLFTSYLDLHGVPSPTDPTKTVVKVGADISINMALVGIVGLLALAELSLAGPVSFYDGIFVYDIVGVQGIAFASGVVGAVGYIGNVVANPRFGSLIHEDPANWKHIWLTAAVLAAVTAFTNVIYWLVDARYVRNLDKDAVARKNEDGEVIA